jgi:hypothetical protein
MVFPKSRAMLPPLVSGSFNGFAFLLARNVGSRMVENYLDVAHLRVKALVRLNVLADLSAFLSSRS